LNGSESVLSRTIINAVGDGAANSSKLQFYTSNAGSPGLALAIDKDQTADYQGNYIVGEQGRQDHAANTMPSPSYYFDGTNDKISISSSANLQPGFGDFSWVARFQSKGLTGVDNPLIEYGSGTDRIVLYLDSSGYVQWYVNDGTNTSTVVGNKTALFADESWHTVVGVTDRGSATGQKIYIDGVEETYSSQGDPTTLTLSIQPSTFRIGTNYVETSWHYGQINDVKIFNKALTATEVKELYSGASVPFKYQGASQTEKVDATVDFSDSTGWSTNGGWSIAGGVASFDGINVGRVGANWVSYTVGKMYRLSFEVKLASALLWIGNNAGSNPYVNGAYITYAVGTHNIEFIAPAAASGGIAFYSNSSGNATELDNVSIKQIGAVAEYDGSSATGGTWYDKSGNNLDGTVTGVSLQNTMGALIVNDRVGIGVTNPRRKLDFNGLSSGDGIALEDYNVAYNTRFYIGINRADTGVFEDTGNGDSPSTVRAGVAGIRIVNTQNTTYTSNADNSVQLLGHTYNGGSRVILHANHNGKVGIGVTNPGETLDVAGGASISNLIYKGKGSTSVGASSTYDTTIAFGGRGTYLVTAGLSGGAIEGHASYLVHIANENMYAGWSQLLENLYANSDFTPLNVNLTATQYTDFSPYAGKEYKFVVRFHNNHGTNSATATWSWVKIGTSL
ncbi:LamG domain-containing protein, partial [Patescibacteria group bacterium AH-259-L05]|nr:LamG domain-containing protein [Patescibacteria group bacterium AH-259-L05]